MWPTSNNSGPNKLVAATSSTTKHQKDVQPEPEVEDEDPDDFENFEDEDGNESGSDEFATHQRMPPQHPATRTCFQLMGNCSLSLTIHHSWLTCPCIELLIEKPGEKPYLDLNPHYQRNVVWTRKAKQMLIDSMFEGFFIPPVRLNIVVA